MLLTAFYLPFCFWDVFFKNSIRAENIIIPLDCSEHFLEYFIWIVALFFLSGSFEGFIYQDPSNCNFFFLECFLCRHFFPGIHSNLSTIWEKEDFSFCLLRHKCVFQIGLFWNESLLTILDFVMHWEGQFECKDSAVRKWKIMFFEELLCSFILTVVIWELCKSVSENWYLVCLCGFWT